MTAIDDLSRLHHIQDAAKEALLFMSGKTRKDLANDRMLQLAVIKDLEIMAKLRGGFQPNVEQDILKFLG